ncbi:MAG: TetR/AcrR family transcriptional regulator [Candidatus Methanomethylophilaceae archaeon]|nr:TetR/AcrR family transcriptional regulator [Candidatus Methanomethylophilaceae archaeon]
MNKKNDILLKTIELFHTKGETVSLDDIATELGCSKTLIIHYFRTKRNLMSSCFSLICHEVRLRLAEVPAPEVCTVENIRSYLADLWRAYFGYLMENPQKARFFIQYTHSHGPFPPKYRTVDEVIRRIFEDKYGCLTDEHPELMFDIKYMVAIANGMAALVFADKTEASQDLPELCIDKIMNGVVPKREGSGRGEKVHTIAG